MVCMLSTVVASAAMGKQIYGPENWKEVIESSGSLLPPVLMKGRKAELDHTGYTVHFGMLALLIVTLSMLQAAKKPEKRPCFKVKE